MRTRSLCGLAILAVIVAGVVQAADWTQFRGPDRTDRSADKGLLKTWPKAGPALAWTFTAAGNGYGGPAVVGDRVYLLGMEKDIETMFALDASNGKPVWTSPLAKVWDFEGNSWSRGPNATPTVDGDLIFGLGSQGMLVCVDTKGKEVWRKDLVKDLGAQVTPAGGGPDIYHWGFCWSPLVDGDHLILTPGGPNGLFAALDKKTGKVLWQSKGNTEECSYCSPVVAEIAGVRQYITNTQKGPVAVDTTGKVLWTAKPKRKYGDMVIPTPVVSGDQVFVTATTANGDLFKITKDGEKFVATAVWTTKDLANFHGGVVLVDKHLYGSHETRDWKCIDLARGTTVWEAKSDAVGTGSLTYADGHLFLYAQDTGDVAMIEASPAGYKEEGRFALPMKSSIRKASGKFWTHPVVANGHLFLRDQENLFCYTIK
jgi:outer membrane protein assembly factor BamB